MQGERIRVAVAWYSAAGAPLAYPYVGVDTLATNFDLYVYRTDPNSPDATSVSVNNNHEIVEFVAPATAQYTIGVKKQSASESDNTLGIAWTKQATYTPDVRRVPAAGQHGLNSTLYVRNNGALARSVEAEFVDTSGSFYGNPTGSVGANQVWTAQQPNYPWVGAGIVDGSEDLSVAVANRRIENPHADAAYAGVSWL